MSKWSSFEKQQLLTESWREYLNEEEIDEGLADRLKLTAKGAYKGGKEAWEKSRPKVMSDYPATEIATIVKTISDLGKKADIPVNTAKIVDEFEEMLKAQNFVIKEQKLELGADLKLDLSKAPTLEAFMVDLAKKDKNLLAPLIKALSNGSFDVGEQYKSIATQLDKLKPVEAPSAGAKGPPEKVVEPTPSQAEEEPGIVPTPDVKPKEDEPTPPRKPEVEKPPVDQRSTPVTPEFEPEIEIEIENDELKDFIKELDLGEIGITGGEKKAKRIILNNLPSFYKMFGDELKKRRIQDSFKLPEIPSTPAEIPDVKLRNLLSLAFNRIIYRFIKEMTTGNKQIPSEVEDELEQIAPPPKDEVTPDEKAPELAASEEEETDETPEGVVTSILKSKAVSEEDIKAFLEDLKKLQNLEEVGQKDAAKALGIDVKKYKELKKNHPAVTNAISRKITKEDEVKKFLEALAKIVVKKAAPSKAEPPAPETEPKPEEAAPKVQAKKPVKKKKPKEQKETKSFEEIKLFHSQNLRNRVLPRNEAETRAGLEGKMAMVRRIKDRGYRLVIDDEDLYNAADPKDLELAKETGLRMYNKYLKGSYRQTLKDSIRSYLYGLQRWIAEQEKEQINESVMLRWKTIAGIK